MTRRHALVAPLAALTSPAAPFKISVFSKHLQFLHGEALARAAANMGFDGVDLAVRKGGHIEPERAAAELPALVRTLREHRLEVPMITSGIVDAATPHAEEVMKTLAELGIRYYRWGGFRYDLDRPIPEQIEALKPRVARLAALNRRHGLCAIYHTHSGPGQVGASIWDLHLLLRDFDPAFVAINYDTAHATIEGGYGGWVHSLRLAGLYLKGIAVKDFLWAATERGEWRPQWRPLGEGMVRFPQFFKLLAGAGFNGPVQMHFEYPLGGAESGRTTIAIPPEQVFAAMRKDLRQLRNWLLSPPA